MNDEFLDWEERHPTVPFMKHVFAGKHYILFIV